jgi:hypothetical protein
MQQNAELSSVMNAYGVYLQMLVLQFCRYAKKRGLMHPRADSPFSQANSSPTGTAFNC